MRAGQWMSGFSIVGGLGVLILLGTVFRNGLPQTRSGHIVAVDPGERVLVLAVTRPGGHGESLTVRVAPAARIQHFDETFKIKDLTPGQLVDVTTRPGPQGTQEATTIRIRGGPKVADRPASLARLPSGRETGCPDESSK